MAMRTCNPYAAVENQRTWVPGGVLDVIFRRWRTVCGRRLYADDFGYRAWPMTIRRPPSAQKSNPHDHFRPLESALRLQGGLKVGDRVHHRYWGDGTIVAIDERKAFFDFDLSGLVDFDRPKAHYLVTKIP